jgi:hypothetical protein
MAPRTSTHLEDLLAQCLVNQQGQQAAPASSTTKTKLPSDMWKGTIDILLRLTQKDREVDLPEIWHVWANCKKEERSAVLQEQFCKMARELKLPVPVATPELVATIFNLKFAAAYEDKLEHGLQPFMVAYLSQKNVSDHRLMTEGMPTLLDLVDLKAASKISLPTKELQMLRTCRAFGAILAVICGTRVAIYPQLPSRYLRQVRCNPAAC